MSGQIEVLCYVVDQEQMRAYDHALHFLVCNVLIISDDNYTMNKVTNQNKLKTVYFRAVILVC